MSPYHVTHYFSQTLHRFNLLDKGEKFQNIWCKLNDYWVNKGDGYGF